MARIGRYKNPNRTVEFHGFPVAGSAECGRNASVATVVEWLREKGF